MLDFEGFQSIERLQQPIVITEKIHGTNAQILIDGQDIYAGSRTRWITPDDDNYNFAKWVHGNREELIAKLGDGRHFGEWYGLGINAGYGMKERRFVLFNTHRWNPVRDAGELPSCGVDVVPTLYAGPMTASIFDEAMDRLKREGSVLVPGYMKPEGIVAFFTRTNVAMKRTFESEDAAWTYRAERPASPDRAEVEATLAPFWQPLRLEKLLSRDERFGLEYPKSLPALCSAYVEDLEKETEIADDVARRVRKNVFRAIKGMMADKGYAS
jgi:hypothetical protein